jgi:purine-binding chemotaxis protein CheW
MRPLPIEPLAGAPPFVLGLSLIRGSPVPVIDIGLMFGESTLQPRRMVTLKAGGRLVALVAESVLGIHSIRADELSNLPPLLRDAGGDVVSAVGVLDAELLLFLRAARMVPDALLNVLGAAGAA